MPARNCSVCGERIPRQNKSGMCFRCQVPPPSAEMRRRVQVRIDKQREDRELANKYREEHGL